MCEFVRFAVIEALKTEKRRSLIFPEDENYKYEKIEKAKLNLPVISEVQKIEWFEGVRPSAVGLKSKKLYRVRQLTKPARLIVDFQQ